MTSVDVAGTGLAVKLSTQVGSPYDEAAIQKDVHYLWRLDRFDDVRAEQVRSAAGVDIVFRVRPRPHLLLHEVRLLPHTFGLQLKLPEGTPIDAVSAHRIADEVRSQFEARGYPDAIVGERLVPVKYGIVNLQLTIDTGKQVHVKRSKTPCVAPPDTLSHYITGRIEFTGNRHYSDRLLRRNFLLREAEPFDERLLLRSLARLNRAGYFEPIDPRAVVVQPDPVTGVANVTVNLRERQRGNWSISGPVGPMSIAGPLRASVGARMPRWSTYVFSVGLFAFGKPLLPIVNAPKRFTPILSLQRPFSAGTGWLSGFAVAPQLGWRNTGAGYLVGQLQGRLLPRLGNDGAMPCEPKHGRLRPLRTTAAIALQFMGALVQ